MSSRSDSIAMTAGQLVDALKAQFVTGFVAGIAQKDMKMARESGHMLALEAWQKVEAILRGKLGDEFPD